MSSHVIFIGNNWKKCLELWPMPLKILHKFSLKLGLSCCQDFVGSVYLYRLRFMWHAGCGNSLILLRWDFRYIWQNCWGNTFLCLCRSHDVHKVTRMCGRNITVYYNKRLKIIVCEMQPCIKTSKQKWRRRALRSGENFQTEVSNGTENKPLQ